MLVKKATCVCWCGALHVCLTPYHVPCCVTGDRYDPEPRTRRMYKDDHSERSHDMGGEEESRGHEYHDEQSSGSAVRAYRDEPESKEEDDIYHDELAEKKDMQRR